MSQVDTTSTRFSLWFAFLAGPLAWTAHELLSYVLVRPACSNGLLFLEYVVTLGMLAVAGAGLYIAYRHVRSDGTPHFLSLASIVLNLLFGFAIIMETIPTLVVSPCL